MKFVLKSRLVSPSRIHYEFYSIWPKFQRTEAKRKFFEYNDFCYSIELQSKGEWLFHIDFQKMPFNFTVFFRFFFTLFSCFIINIQNPFVSIEIFYQNNEIQWKLLMATNENQTNTKNGSATCFLICDLTSVFYINFPIDYNCIKLCCCCCCGFICLVLFVLLYLVVVFTIVYLNLSLINTVLQIETISLVLNLLLTKRNSWRFENTS